MCEVIEELLESQEHGQTLRIFPDRLDSVGFYKGLYSEKRTVYSIYTTCFQI